MVVFGLDISISSLLGSKKYYDYCILIYLEIQAAVFQG